MAITVLETTKRYQKLVEYARKLGFSVDEKDDHMIWSSENNEQYIVFPYVDNFEMPKDNVLSNKTVIAVRLDGEKAESLNNVTSLNEIKILCEMVDNEALSKEQAQILWDIVFRRSNLGAFLNFLDNKEMRPQKSKVSDEDINIDDKIRTAVVTACGPELFIDIISEYLQSEFVFVGRKMFINKEDLIIIQLVSKLYERNKYDEYWYSVHSYQIEEMSKHKQGYYSFGFSGRNVTVLIEKDTLIKLLPSLTESPNNGDTYWHIKIDTNVDGDFYILKTKKGMQDIDINTVEGIIVVDRPASVSLEEKVDKQSKSNRITLRDTGLKEVSCKKRR